MAFLGFLIQLMTAGFVFYLGYTIQLNYILILVSPLGFIIGGIIKRNARTKTTKPGFFGFLGELVSSYLAGLVAAVIFWAAGYGVLHLLGLAPPPGTGRY